jgi:hypothetical protein
VIGDLLIECLRHPTHFRGKATLAGVQRRAAGTVRDVRCSLKRVCGMLRPRYPDQESWKLPLEAFLWWIEQVRTAGTTRQTLARYVTHMRCLLDYAGRSDRAERNVLDGFQLQDPVALSNYAGPHFSTVIVPSANSKCQLAVPRRRDRGGKIARPLRLTTTLVPGNLVAAC